MSNLTPDEQAEINEFGYDSKNVRPETLKKAFNAVPVALIPDSVASIPAGSVIGKIGETIDNLAYGSFAIPKTNWGGPLYSAGKTFAKNQIITPQDLEVKPTNKADELYKLHDIDTQESSTKPTLDQRIEAIKEADRKFISRAEDVLRRDNLTTYEKFLLHSSILAFKAKLKTDIGYKTQAEYYITDPRAFDAGNIAYFRNQVNRSNRVVRNYKKQTNQDNPIFVTEFKDVNIPSKYVDEFDEENF